MDIANGEPELVVQVAFTDAALRVLGRKRGPSIRGPQPFLEQARFVQPGDFLRLEGTAGLFEVSHRVWHVMQDQVTLKLVLDGPVQDDH